MLCVRCVRRAVNNTRGSRGGGKSRSGGVGRPASWERGITEKCTELGAEGVGEAGGGVSRSERGAGGGRNIRLAQQILNITLGDLERGQAVGMCTPQVPTAWPLQ